MAVPEIYTAFAVDTSTLTTTARTTPVDITINRWSVGRRSRSACWQVLRDKGQDALLSQLQKLPMSSATSTRPARCATTCTSLASRSEAEGGRMIFLLTDRYIGSWEASNRPRTIDYPFTLSSCSSTRTATAGQGVDLHQDHAEANAGTIELENFANQPVMLNEVRQLR